MRKENLALEGASFLRARLDFVLALRKAAEEILGIQLLEVRFGALERQLGQSLGAKTALGVDAKQVARAFHFEARPRASVDGGVQSKVAVGVVELEEQLGLLKRLGLRSLPGGERRREESEREGNSEQPERPHELSATC